MTKGWRMTLLYVRTAFEILSLLNRQLDMQNAHTYNHALASR